MTNHGRIALVDDFYQACKENDINPIIGCEFYVSHGKYDDKTPENKERWHITVLAKNNQGVKNLYHLSYLMNKNGFYYKPRIDDDLLFKYKEGLIVLSGCAGSEINSHLRRDEGYEYNFDKAVEVAKKFKEQFGEDYYIELQDHPMRSTGKQWPIQDSLNKDLTKIAKMLNIKRVLTADCHYANSDDHEAHEVLLCIGTGKYLSDKDRMSLDEFDLSLKSPEVLYERWKDDVEVLENTLEINDKVHIEFNLEEQAMPEFNVPDGMSMIQYLKLLTYRGAVKRFLKEDNDFSISECYNKLTPLNENFHGQNFTGIDILERIEMELGVVNKIGVPGYFLIVQEYINWAKNNGIRVGCGRGCFTPNQLVGRKRIKNVEIGSKVRTFNGQMQKVTNKFEYDVDEDMIRLYLNNGKTLELTKDHKVMTKNNYFVEAQNLKVGDILLGNKSKHEKIEICCSDCKKSYKTSVGHMIELLNNEKTCHNKGEYLCISCFNRRYQEKVGVDVVQQRMTKRLKDEDVRKKISDGVLKQMNENSLREKISQGWKNKKKFDKESYDIWRENIGKGSRKNWQNIKFRRKIEEKRNKCYKSGTFYSERQMKNIHFDSSYEEMFLQKLELDANVKSFDRCRDIIKYDFDGQHSYNPDFEVVYKNGDVKIFEIKGFWTEKVEAKKNAAIEYYKDKKKFYQILYLEDIQKFNELIHNDIVIEKIETFHYTGKVYDLQVEDNHNYNVNGICVHNSSLASLMCYCLRITEVNPLGISGFMFERFLNPDRISLPDVDTDFEARYRDKVIQHFKDIYGEDHVVGIGVQSTMRSKNAVRDVARVLEYPFDKSLELTKLLPDAEHTGAPKLKEYIASDEELQKLYDNPEQKCETPEFRERYNTEPEVKRIVDIAIKLEGKQRNHGIHACGTVISPEPIWNYFPTEISNDVMATTVPMHSVELGGVNEKGGLLKIDVLGLSTLDLISDTLSLIKKTKGIDVDIDNVDLEDEETLRAYREGRCKDTFTFSSQGMQETLKGLKVDKFSDLVLVNAMYRPGAMDYIKDAIDVKNGVKKPYYWFNREKLLEETYGIIAYQEQGMEIAKFMGFTGGETDNMRKALAKKNKGFLDAIFPTFKEKAIKKGFSEQEVDKYWDSLIGFSRYSFNKAHAYAYAVLGYQTGYLKTHYPSEYYAAYFNHVSGDKEKLGKAIKNAKEIGIKVLPPDAEKSGVNFTVDDNGNILYGFSAIKGVGKSSEIILDRRKEKEINSIKDFFTMFENNELNVRKMEMLAKAGVLDNICKKDPLIKSRSRLLFNFEEIYEKYKTKKNVKRKQQSLFELENDKPRILEPLPKYKIQTLQYEKEVLGTYVSKHPLDYASEIEDENWEDVCNSQQDLENKTKKTVKCLGTIESCRVITTKKGQKMCFMTLLGKNISFDVTVFPSTFEKYKDILKNGNSLFMTNYVDDYNEIDRRYKYIMHEAKRVLEI